MIPRFHWADVSTVCHYMGTLAIGTGLAMLIPAIVGFIFGETSCAVNFLFSAAFCLLVGAAFRLFLGYGLDRRRLILTVGLGWVVVALLASIPLYLCGGFPSLLEAVYDAVSALTTTGFSLADDLDHMAYSCITWRCVLTIFGGQSVIMIALYFGLFNEGDDDTQKSSPRSGEAARSGIRHTLRIVWIIAAVLIVLGTAIGFVICLVAGFNPGDAIMNGFWLSSMAYDTGGFVPHSAGLIYYHSLALQIMIVPLMIFGAINCVVYAHALRGHGSLLRHDSELRGFLIWIAVLVVAVAFILAREAAYSQLSGLLSHGTFMAITSATTGGMQTVYPEQMGTTFAAGALLILMLAAIIGGSSNSTAGGIKMSRIMLILHWLGHSVRMTLLPDSAHVNARYNHFGSRQLTSSAARSAMLILFLYVVTVAIGAMDFIAHGYDALAAIFESISHTANAGISCGIVSGDMSLDLKIICIAQMWLGRVEFIALFAAIVGVIVSFSPRRRSTSSARARRRRGWRKESGSLHRAPLVLTVLLVCALAAAPLAANLTSQLPEALAAEQQATETQGPTEEQPDATDEDVSEEAEGSTIATLRDFPELTHNATYRKVTIDELLSADDRLDGRAVRFSGEAIGTALSAEEGYRWVNLLSDGQEIGVLMNEKQVAKIKHFGSYGEVGDTVTVRGVFHLACDAHADELEVHAANVKIKDRGHTVTRGFSSRRVTIAIIFVVLAVAIYVVERLIRRRRESRLLDAN
ncbi:MAG: hypothetical protein LUD25_00535 [Coriobacteriaceae bacterium]|nr:hypothetical protein [Coriobacteriaceae bacterium]